MGGHKSIHATSAEVAAAAPPLPPEHDLVVTGGPEPDCKGYYDIAGTHDGQNWYRHITLDYVIIWWGDPDFLWLIGPVGVDPGSCLWAKEGVLVTGTYDPANGAGNPIVSEV